MSLGQDPLGRDTWTTKIKKDMLGRCPWYATLPDDRGRQLPGLSQITPGETRRSLTGLWIHDAFCPGASPVSEGPEEGEATLNTEEKTNEETPVNKVAIKGD